MCVFVQSIGVDDVVASAEPMENVRVLFIGGGGGGEQREGERRGVWALEGGEGGVWQG